MELKKILVVEDEGIVAKDLQTCLKGFGYEVPAIATSGQEAIQKAADTAPDLVLMDIRLKGNMDGVEAARQIYTRFNIPVIYLTAYADENTLERAKSTVPFGYILKPFEERELQTAIEIALYKHRLEKDLKDSQQWLSAVLKSMGEAVIATDINRLITFINPVAEALTGWQQEEAIGKDLTEILPLLKEISRTQLSNPIIQALDEGVVVYPIEQTLLLTKDGTEVPIADSAAPIKDNNGEITGAVWVFWDMTERKRAAEQICQDALHDPLTGLPNRTLLMDRLECAFERVKRHPNYLFAVLFLDLDRFKVINDSLGHTIGDQLLCAIASRIKACIRASDTVARLGGDEFAILLHDIPDLSDACRTADRIEQQLMLPFNLDRREVFTTASIGITLSSNNYERAEDLLRDADLAMYRAKSQGRACYQVFDTTMYTQVVTLLQLENDLRRAIEREEFRVYYQPIISLTKGTIVGFEALLRWQRGAEGGLVPPAKFISVAEETGLIVPINWWVLREACRQMQVWQKQFPANPPLTIAVNFSSKQFAQPHLVEDIHQILQETGLDARSLRIEITETALIQNPEAATPVLLQLKTLGIQLNIDDFGTGYSSLSYLHRFPIDTMKIDRSFISSLGDDGENVEIVRAIVTLAHSLGIEVIAEGVETAEQVERLRELKCSAGQGYFFSMPLAPFQVGALMSAELVW